MELPFSTQIRLYMAYLYCLPTLKKGTLRCSPAFLVSKEGTHTWYEVGDKICRLVTRGMLALAD